jgi:hypothetical protein
MDSVNAQKKVGLNTQPIGKTKGKATRGSSPWVVGNATSREGLNGSVAEASLMHAQIALIPQVLGGVWLG